MTIEKFPNVEYPATWLYKIADNKAIDMIKTRHVEARLTENIADSFFIDDLITEEDIKQGMAKLDKESQVIIFLHHWEGYNHKEISGLMNLSCSNVRVRISRAYSVLKKYLK